MASPRIKQVRLGAGPDGAQRALTELGTSVQDAVDQLHQASAGAKRLAVKMRGANLDTVLRHGLGREVTWRVVDINQPAHVWRSATKPADPLNTLILKTDWVLSAVAGFVELVVEVL